MSKTSEQLVVGFVVWDSAQLPDGLMSSDDVKAELAVFLGIQLEAWYNDRGKDLVVFEPMVG